MMTSPLPDMTAPDHPYIMHNGAINQLIRNLSSSDRVRLHKMEMDREKSRQEEHDEKRRCMAPPEYEKWARTENQIRREEVIGAQKGRLPGNPCARFKYVKGKDPSNDQQRRRGSSPLNPNAPTFQPRTTTHRIEERTTVTEQTQAGSQTQNRNPAQDPEPSTLREPAMSSIPEPRGRMPSISQARIENPRMQSATEGALNGRPIFLLDCPLVRPIDELREAVADPIPDSVKKISCTNKVISAMAELGANIEDLTSVKSIWESHNRVCSLHRHLIRDQTRAHWELSLDFIDLLLDYVRELIDSATSVERYFPSLAGARPLEPRMTWIQRGIVPVHPPGPIGPPRRRCCPVTM